MAASFREESEWKAVAENLRAREVLTRDDLNKIGDIDSDSRQKLLQNLKSLDAKEKLSAEVMEEIELILSNKPVHPDH